MHFEFQTNKLWNNCTVSGFVLIGVLFLIALATGNGTICGPFQTERAPNLVIVGIIFM